MLFCRQRYLFALIIFSFHRLPHFSPPFLKIFCRWTEHPHTITATFSNISSLVSIIYHVLGFLLLLRGREERRREWRETDLALCFSGRYHIPHASVPSWTLIQHALCCTIGDFFPFAFADVHGVQSILGHYDEPVWKSMLSSIRDINVSKLRTKIIPCMGCVLQLQFILLVWTDGRCTPFCAAWCIEIGLCVSIYCNTQWRMKSWAGMSIAFVKSADTTINHLIPPWSDCRSFLLLLCASRRAHCRSLPPSLLSSLPGMHRWYGRGKVVSFASVHRKEVYAWLPAYHWCRIWHPYYRMCGTKD